jgi:actin-related protein
MATPYVVDIGSSAIKGGPAGSERPAAIVPHITGRSYWTMALVGIQSKDLVVGDMADANRAMLRITYPVESGRVSDWELYERALSHVFFCELRILAEEQPLLMSEPLPAPGAGAQDEKRLEILYEALNANQLALVPAPRLALAAANRTSGIVLSVGDGLATCSAYPAAAAAGAPPGEHHAAHPSLGGRQLTRHLGAELAASGWEPASSADMLIVKNIKERLCAVVPERDGLAHAQAPDLMSFELPDAQVIALGQARFKGPEALFRPSILGHPDPGLHRLVTGVAARYDRDVQAALLQNIVVEGGTTQLPGFVERLEAELRAVLPSAVNFNVHAPADRALSVWSGGSHLASAKAEALRGVWLTRAEYDEHGALNALERHRARLARLWEQL